MKYKKGLVFICLIICLISIASVTASDVDDTSLQTEDYTMNEVISSNDVDNHENSDNITSDKENDQTIIAASDENYILSRGHSFEELQDLIDNTEENGEINLTNDYTLYNSGDTIKISKSITINGNGHTLDGNHKNTILSIEIDGKHVTLKNIKFKNGGYKKNNQFLNTNGGAISYNIKWTPDPTGYSSYSDATTLTIDHCDFEKNGARERGGAIYCYGGYGYFDPGDGKLTITNCEFKNNIAQTVRGGAIFCDIYEINITNSSFENNEVQKISGMVNNVAKITNYRELLAFTVPHDPVEPDASGVSHNLILTGGAIYSGKAIYINNSEFKNNIAGTDEKEAGTSGGAIHCVETIYAYNCNFTNNIASDWGGGAIFSEKECRLYDSKFDNNQANKGCAVYCFGTVFAVRTEFSDNFHEEGTTWLENELYEIDIKGIPVTKILTEWGIDMSAFSLFFKSEGGAIWTHEGCYVDSCQFEGNHVCENGGAIHSDGFVSIYGENNVFNNNNVYRGDTDSQFDLVLKWKFIDKVGGAIYCSGNLVIKNANIADNYAINNGGAIYCEKDCSLYNCDIEDNYLIAMDARKNVGGAIYTNTLSTVKDCHFYGNKIGHHISNTNWGGCIFVYNECNPELISTTFEMNSVWNSGGAVFLESGKSKLTVTDCHFINNTARVDGGAIFTKGPITVDNSSFYSNWACNHGGAIYTEKGIEITNSKFTYNQADNEGGAIHTSTIIKPVSNSQFIGNEARNGNGGALYITDNCKPEFTSCIFEKNTCRGFGGSIFLNPFNDYLKLSSCTFNNNKAYKNGGAIYNNYLEGVKYSTTDITNCNFTGNSANEGGAVFASKIETFSNSQFINNKANGDGGALYVNNFCNPVLTSCIFEKNTCEGTGGAICLFGYGNHLKLSGCTFNDNHANNGQGGAIFNRFDLSRQSITDMSNCKFTDNSAKVDGGAVFTAKIETVSNSQFINNKANTKCGGALYAYYHCDPEITSCIFEKNTCKDSGGAIFLFGYENHLKLSGCTFNDNHANNGKGGAIFNNYDPTKHSITDITNCKFTSNSAKVDGGAVFTAKIEKTVSNSLFEKNTCEGTGGAICMAIMYSTLKVSDSTFIRNSAKYGGAIYGQQIAQITSSVFLKNDATADGGAVYINNNAFSTMNHDTEIISCRFEGNTCKDKGGAIYEGYTYSHLKLSYCTFVDNNANKGNSVYNNGYYDLFEMCWFGTNKPDFKGQFVEHHWNGDEDHTPSNYLRIAMKLNDTHPYMGNTYKTTVYFYPVNGGNLNKDLLHSTGTFYGDGNFSNVKATGPNDMTADVKITNGTCTIYGNLDHETVPLTINSAVKKENPIKILSCVGGQVSNGVKVTFGVLHLNEGVKYVIKDTQGNIIKQQKFNPLYRELTIRGLPPGSYSITIINPESWEYLESSDNATFNITKGNVAGTIEVYDVTYPGTVEFAIDGTEGIEWNLTVTKDSNVVASRTFVINYDYDEYDDDPDDPYDYYVHINIGTLNPGKYEATLSFKGNEYYNSYTTNRSFNVNSEGTLFEIEVNASEITYGKTTTVTHILPEDATGTIKYYLANGTFLGELSVNENLTLPKWEVGSYIIIGNYSGDTHHAPQMDTTNVIVKKAKTVFEIETNVNYTTEVVTVTHILPEDATGTIKYYLANGTFLGELSVHENLTLPKWEVGSYTIIGNYSGDRNFFNATANTTFSINKAKPVFEIEINACEITYGETTTVTHILPENATGTIKYYLANGTFLGELSVHENLTLPKWEVGSYTIIGNYSGDRNFFNATANTTFSINKAKTEIIARPVITTYKDDDYLLIELKDIHDKPVADVNVTVDLNGAENYTTDENGQIKISTSNLGVNTYDVYISFNGTDNYFNCSNATQIFVSKRPSQMATTPLVTIYQVHKYLVVNLKDTSGNPIANVDTFIVIHGVTYNCTTNENGDARLIIRLLPNEYIATAVFDNENYTISLEKVKVTVYKANPKIIAKNKKFKATKKVKKYTITLKDNIGKAIKNAKVTLKIKGKTYKAKTNSQGKATFKIKKLTKKGKFKATVTYEGNIRFNKVTKKVKIICIK